MQKWFNNLSNSQSIPVTIIFILVGAYFFYLRNTDLEDSFDTYNLDSYQLEESPFADVVKYGRHEMLTTERSCGKCAQL